VVLPEHFRQEVFVRGCARSCHRRCDHLTALASYGYMGLVGKVAPELRPVNQRCLRVSRALEFSVGWLLAGGLGRWWLCAVLRSAVFFV
jgi:hypothetical protein